MDAGRLLNLLRKPEPLPSFYPPECCKKQNQPWLEKNEDDDVRQLVAPPGLMADNLKHPDTPIEEVMDHEGSLYVDEGQVNWGTVIMSKPLVGTWTLPLSRHWDTLAQGF